MRTRSQKRISAVKADGILDYYAAYQYLDAMWENASLDLESMKVDGFEIVRDVQPNIEVVEKEGKRAQGSPEGLGQPRSSVRYRAPSIWFPEAKKELADSEGVLSSLNSEFDEIMESFDENDLSDSIFDQEKEGHPLVSKEFNKKSLRDQEAIKQGYEVEEDSFEDKVMKLSELKEDISAEKKKAKAIAKDKLEVDTKRKNRKHLR